MRPLKSEPELHLPPASSPAVPYLVDATSHPATRTSHRPWQQQYVRRLVASDAVCAALASTTGLLIRFGAADSGPSPVSIGMALVLPIVWVLSMLVLRTYEKRFLWEGPEEFRRVFLASALLLATVGTASWAVKLEVARGFIVAALPLATVATLVTRYVWRQRMRRRQRAGACIQNILLVGHARGLTALHRQIVRESRAGHCVVGCCVPAGGGRPQEVDGLQVFGDLDAVVRAVRRYDVDSVVLLPGPELDGPALRRLAWELEKTSAELLLAPAVTEIVGPRVRIRPMSGLPLVHLERPELRGIRRLTKAVFDRSAATAGLLLLLPLLLGVALAVKLTSWGPVFYRQERVGRHGATFSMLKFRTMVEGADQMVDALAADSDGNGVLFKKKVDPRVTGIGRVLRRYSLDELPQLLNVVLGEMSLVGPRPPLPREVDHYGMDMHRRFLVKPGLTGLWQVSGRSDLSWDESVRIDLRYIENWSLSFDLMILWRTLGAVLRGSGAY